LVNENNVIKKEKPFFSTTPVEYNRTPKFTYFSSIRIAFIISIFKSNVIFFFSFA